MKAELRPKIYLFLCLIALALEGLYIFLHRPISCVKCRVALTVPARELPEFCQPCVDQIRSVLAPVPVSYDPPYPVDPQDPVVVLETSRGRVEVELFVKQTPLSAQNFLHYVREHRYDGVIFHRIEDYLVVSGRYRGGYDGAALDTITIDAPIKSESGRFENRIGTLSLPRLDHDADTATSDFFFNLKDAPHYNRVGDSPKQAGYAVFGQVVHGYDVLDRMRYLPVTDKPMTGFERMPKDAIVIRRAYEKPPAILLGTVATIDTRVIEGRVK